MSRFVIDHPAPAGGWQEVRPHLERALAADLPIRLRQRWGPEELYLEGAGAAATIRLVKGRLRAEADLRPPASFFSSVIERELRRAIERTWPAEGRSEPAAREGQGEQDDRG